MFYTQLANSVSQIVSTYLYNIQKIEWFWIHPWMNDVNDGCLAVGEGITEKVSEFLVI